MTHHIEADRNKQNNTARLPARPPACGAETAENRQDDDGTQLKTGASGRPASIKSSQATDGDKLMSEKHKHSLIMVLCRCCWATLHGHSTDKGATMLPRRPALSTDQFTQLIATHSEISVILRVLGVLGIFPRVFETNYLYGTKLKTLKMEI